MSEVARTWLTRYEDEARTSIIARTWFEVPDQSKVREKPELAFIGEVSVTNPDDWQVFDEDGGAWIGGQFCVRQRVSLKNSPQY